MDPAFLARRGQGKIRGQRGTLGQNGEHPEEVLQDMKVEYEEAVGEAAFYGPKVDYQMANVLGREETASTIQLDFSAAAKFGLEYAAPDGTKQRPLVIHRAPMGSHERFVAFLIEHLGGAFPTWLAPIQVRGACEVAEELGPPMRKNYRHCVNRWYGPRWTRPTIPFPKRFVTPSPEDPQYLDRGGQ